MNIVINYLNTNLNIRINKRKKRIYRLIKKYLFEYLAHVNVC